METFVVRVYRRECVMAPARRAYDRVAVIGIVEHADGGTRKAFHAVEELWAVLARSGNERSTGEAGDLGAVPHESEQ